MKNGQLWFNTVTNRVERIRSLGPIVVATTYHKQDLNGWVRSQFRAATTTEVKTYLEQPKEKQVVLSTEGKVLRV